MFRAILSEAVFPVTVATQYGDLSFRFRSVHVITEHGAVVDEFQCEDTPEAFDAKALEHGWHRAGVAPDGAVLLTRHMAYPALPNAARRPAWHGPLKAFLWGLVVLLGLFLTLAVAAIL